MNWQIVVSRKIPWSELNVLEENGMSEISGNRSLCKLIISEPQPTFTHGKSAPLTDLLWTPERLQALGAVVARVARGGKWTYHGPGQALVFPMMHLPTQGFSRFGVREFMVRFREAAQRSLLTLGINAKPKDCPYGLYVEDAKIASFGLAIRNGISTHGMALYIAPQHNWFQAIHPCGVENALYTCVQAQCPKLSWEDTVTNLTTSLKTGFQHQ